MFACPKRDRRRAGTTLTLSCVVAALLTMPMASVGCKPADEKRRRPHFPDPLADARTRLPAHAGPDVWLAAQSSRHRDVDGPTPAVDLENTAPLERAIVAARDAFSTKDFRGLLEIAARPEATSAPEILQLVVRARSRQGRTSAAVLALEQLSGLPNAEAALVGLRLHPDTEALRHLKSFRRLTRYLDVSVSATTTRGTKQLTPLIAALRQAGLPARAGRRWRGRVKAATIYYTRDLPAAQRVAQEVHDALALPPVMASSRVLTKRRPLVLVLPPAAIAALNPTGQKTRVDDFFGRTLVAQDGTTRHAFLLKDTGFFRWTTESSGKPTVERTGRYHLYATKIALSYRVVEADGAASPPRVEQGRRSTHRFRLAADGFRLDRWTFRAL